MSAPCRGLLAAFLTLAAAGWAVFADDADYARFLQRFRTVKTLRATFYQRLGGPGGVEEGHGTVVLKRPGKMRWEYRDQERKLFVLNGSSFQCYQPEEKQLLVQTLNSQDLEETPLIFLLGGKRELAADYRAAALGGMRYVLTPLRRGGVFTRIVLQLAGNPPFLSEITLTEENGNVHLYRFGDVRLDGPVDDSLFRFVPPPGTEVLQEE